VSAIFICCSSRPTLQINHTICFSNFSVLNGSILAMQKRIFTTKFLNEAWQKQFASGKCHPASYFEKSGKNSSTG
jgi:hypothetical protein